MRRTSAKRASSPFASRACSSSSERSKWSSTARLPEEAPSNLGIVGRYVLTPEIFDALEKTPPGKGGEIQITDGLALLLRQQPMFAYQFQGRRYDTGRPVGLIKASVELALRRPDIGPELRRYLRGLDLSD